jgi:hypothetical protein
VRSLVLALLMAAAGSTTLSAQVLCLDCGNMPQYSPHAMIDYGRGLARHLSEWQPAQITETTIAWQRRVRTGTYYYLFDRMTGRIRQTLTHDPGYTNPPYVSEFQCQKVECPKPPY